MSRDVAAASERVRALVASEEGFLGTGVGAVDGRESVRVYVRSHDSAAARKLHSDFPQMAVGGTTPIEIEATGVVSTSW
jgi:hypothetical protein